MAHQRPAGFGFLAVCCFAFAVLMAVFLADDAHVGELLVDRVIVGVAGALALLAGEALWFVRKWAYRASLAFAGMLVLILFLVMDPSLAGLVMAAVSLLYIGFALRAVHRGTRPGPTAGRIRVPAPRP